MLGSFFLILCAPGVPLSRIKVSAGTPGGYLGVTLVPLRLAACIGFGLGLGESLTHLASGVMEGAGDLAICPIQASKKYPAPLQSSLQLCSRDHFVPGALCYWPTLALAQELFPPLFVHTAHGKHRKAPAIASQPCSW